MSLVRFGQHVRAPFTKLGRLYNATAQRSPVGTGLATTVLKTSLADLFAQRVMEKREEVDWQRHAMFCSFGLVYLGCWQYYLYNHLFVRWCSSITAAVGHAGSAPIKTFIDQAIHHPFIYFPAFYSLKGAVEGRSLQASMTRYRADLWENCKALWMIWVPAQLINFALVPRHLRIPFVAAVSFAWTVVISCMRGALEKSPAPATADASGAGASSSHFLEQVGAVGGPGAAGLAAVSSDAALANVGMARAGGLATGSSGSSSSSGSAGHGSSSSSSSTAGIGGDGRGSSGGGDGGGAGSSNGSSSISGGGGSSSAGSSGGTLEAATSTTYSFSAVNRTHSNAAGVDLGLKTLAAD